MTLGGLDPKEAIRLAEPHIKQALELNDQLAEVQIASATYEYRKENVDAAESAIKKALTLNPNYVPAIIMYSRLLQFQGDLEGSVKEVRHAVDLDPLSIVARGRLGGALFSIGRLGEAAKVYANLEQQYPDNPRVYDYTTNYYDRLGDLPSMIRATMRLYELRPEDTWMPANLVRAYIGLEDWENAQLWIDRGDAISPDTQYSVASHLLYHWARGELKALEAYADDTFGPGALPRQHIILANIKMLNGNFEAARLLYEQALHARGFYEGQKVTRDIDQTLFYLMFAYQKLGMGSRFEQLKNNVVRVVEGWPIHTRGDAMRRAELSAALGNREKTLEWLKEVVEKNLWKWWFIQNGPVFQDLGDDPEFQAIIADVKRRLAPMRAEVEFVAE